MYSNWNNHGLPFLPGYTFRDLTKSAFHRPQTLTRRNGYAVPKRPSMVIGNEPILSEQLTIDMDKLRFERPDIAYNTSDKPVYEDFIPAHVALDKKISRFSAYFLEEIFYSPNMEYRIRPVIIYYYLEDDSMCIIEPVVDNSGLSQGKRLKRQRLPKNERGEHYQWKDLNLGMDSDVYGVKYHITQCDPFTKEFMESEGIVLNEPEPTPEDPYSRSKKKDLPLSNTTPFTFDKSYRFFHMDCKVLRFYALRVESDGVYSDTWPVIIHYYQVDDSVEIREVHEHNSGRDPFPVFLRRQRIPKKLKSDIFPSCVMEVSEELVEEYYSPKDFQSGQTVKSSGHCFLLHNCDGDTKEYYRKNHPDMEMNPIEIPKTEDTKQKKVIPPYNGFGSLEDSLQNCFSLIPAPPKMNVVKRLVNNNKVLRYAAQSDSSFPEDEGRRFISSYHSSNDMISIYEKPRPNSGMISGKFSEKTRVPKPGSTVDNPEFYSPADFAIGATVEVFGHRFVLTNADHYVLKYLESISGQIPSQTSDSLRQKLGVEMASKKAAEENGEEMGQAS